MKKMNFEQMEKICGGNTVYAYEGMDNVDPAKINWCTVGKWTTGIGIVLISFGIPPAGAVAAAAFGTIAGTTTIFC